MCLPLGMKGKNVPQAADRVHASAGGVMPMRWSSRRRRTGARRGELRRATRAALA